MATAITITTAKSRTSKALEMNVRSISSYLKECKRLLNGGHGMILSKEQREAYKLLKNAKGLTADDCTLEFIKSYIPTDDEGRLVRFKKVENKAEFCEKHGIEENDKQFIEIDGRLLYREVRTTWTASQIVTLLCKAADARTKAAKESK